MRVHGFMFKATHISIQCVNMFAHARLDIGAVIQMIASGNGSFATRNFPFRGTFAASFAEHVYTHFKISRIMLTTLCF